MRRTLLAAAAATVIALALPQGSESVMAQDPGMAPEIQINSWINGDGLDKLEDYRGQVVLLEFWNTH